MHTPEKPLLLAIELHRALNEYNLDKSQRNRIDVHIGLDTGSVILFAIRTILPAATLSSG